MAQLILCLSCTWLTYGIFDQWFGKPFIEKGDVHERRFIPEQPRYPGKYTASYRAQTWLLHVTNERGHGWVRVAQELHDSVQVGDAVFVSGKQGRFSHRWYLEDASKKPLKERAQKTKAKSYRQRR